MTEIENEVLNILFQGCTESSEEINRKPCPRCSTEGCLSGIVIRIDKLLSVFQGNVCKKCRKVLFTHFMCKNRTVISEELINR